jgi:DNA-directed RNA polymerase specialized sigma24 family protein
MTDVPDRTLDRRVEWTLSKDSLQRLLTWLDDGADSEGQTYVEMRRRLRDFFRRKNCRPADDLADETLTRVARRLEEEGITRTETPARYCYIVARFVFLEHVRETRTQTIVSRDLGEVAPPAHGPSEAQAAEAASRIIPTSR